jgi:hypothetical protein
MKIFIALFLAVLCTLQSGVVQAKPAPQTRDNWRSVRTNNLFVIGNADAEKLRQVAACRLAQRAQLLDPHHRDHLS